MKLIDKIKIKPLIIDGAMGTVIYEKGIFINSCYEHLSVTDPELILSIHEDYINAGADIIEANTFGANRIKLEAFGLHDQLENINKKAVQLAKEAVGERDVYVVASIGPCLKSNQQFNQKHTQQLKEVFDEQMKIIANEGIEVFFLETFTHSKEIIIAAEVAKKYDVSVFASVTVGKDGETRGGESIENIITDLDKSEFVDCLGINCGLGPAAALSIAERALPLTSKPFTVMANAGLPQEVD